MARLRRELAEKKAESEKEEVWSDLKRSQQLAKEIAAIESKTDTFDKAEKAINDTKAWWRSWTPSWTLPQRISRKCT